MEPTTNIVFPIVLGCVIDLKHNENIKITHKIWHIYNGGICTQFSHQALWILLFHNEHLKNRLWG